MIQDTTVRQRNETLIKGLASSDIGVRKEASDSITEYLRLKNREDGFARKILPAQNVTAANLDRQLNTPDPVILIDMEAESAGAYTIPFGTGPKSTNIRGGRYPVYFSRIASMRYQSDVNRLLTWNMDIRQMLKDFLLKDIQYHEDKQFMGVSNNIVGATPNVVNAAVGCCQNITVGPMTRASLSHARKGLNSTNKRLFASIGLINSITIWDIIALDRTEIGGDLAEKLFLDGEAPGKIMGLDLVITIKHDLVADNDLYQFAAPKFTGNFFVLDDITLSTETNNYMIEFFGYECIGATIKNIASVCKTSFAGSQVDWRTGL